MKPRLPFVTWSLVGINLYVAFFVTGLLPAADDVLPYAWSLDAWTRGSAFHLIASTFVHAGPVHLATNMLALASFGPLVERRLGPVRFALLYLAAGVAGNLAHLVWNPGSPVVGASGSIFGVLGAVLVLAPLVEVAILGLVPMPLLVASALYVAAVPFLTQLTPVLPIAHGAHLGGLVLGVMAVALALPRQAVRVAPFAAIVFGAVWVGVAYAAGLPWREVWAADWEEAVRFLWPLAAAAGAVALAVRGLGRATEPEQA